MAGIELDSIVKWIIIIIVLVFLFKVFNYMTRSKMTSQPPNISTGFMGQEYKYT